MKTPNLGVHETGSRPLMPNGRQVYLDEDLKVRLTRYAERRGMKRYHALQIAVERFLDAEEGEEPLRA